MPFDVLVPVKSLDRAKSRLLGLPRGALMRAFALDTVSAALASPAVRTTYIVTADDDVARDAEALGCRRLPDRGDGDLNRALVRAAEQVPDGAGVAALLGDLPYLRTDDLSAALEVVPPEGGVVADADGTGSTLLASHTVAGLRPRFGVGSFGAHLEAGYTAITLAVPTLRRDVDTASDLDEAAGLRLGPHTRQTLGTQRGR